MKLYNSSTDSLIISVKPYFVKGFVDHYKAIDLDTGKRLTLSLDQLKEYQKLSQVDITYYRDKDAFEDMDDFMRKTM